jgi:hypothetical protein
MKTFEEFYNQAKEAQNLNEIAAAPAAAVVGKSLGSKIIPGVGAFVGAVDAANRISKGDWEGATYSGLGAAANLIPGAGTAAQLALTGVQQARDYQRGTGEFAKGGAFSQYARKPVSTPSTSQNQNPQQSLSLQNRSTLKPTTPIKPVTRQQISQQSGVVGKVSTNTSYQSKLGGAKATTTYGSGGQQMVRANLGNQGINKVSSGQVSANKSYGATLGGVKGTVKYNAQGNRQFQALKPTSQSKPIPKPTPKPIPKLTPKPQQKKFFGLF